MDSGTLKLNTSIEIKGSVQTLAQIVAGMSPDDKVRCETPFRASASEAAFIRMGPDGDPFLHDVGTSTTYYLSDGDKVGLWNAGQELLLASHTAGAMNPIFAATLTTPADVGDENKIPITELIDDPSLIMRTGKNVDANHANAMAIIRHSRDWHAVLAHDELSEQLLLINPIPGSRTPKSTFKHRPISDDDFIRAVEWFNHHGFPRIGKLIVIDAIEAVAKENVISPVRHYLEGLATSIAWSPETHVSKLSRFFQVYFGTKEANDAPGADPKYLSAVAIKFMISAVARALRPGCKVDSMLVLEGAQGAGKSSAARVLAGFDYFSDNLPAMGTKDASDHIRGKWIIEVGELSAMQKSEVESTKAFISRQEEKFRPAYNRKEITYKRRCVFIGTTNQDAYLRDETGNRRFWPVRVETIDLTRLKRDRDMLWAEAVYRYRAGEKWHLTDDEMPLAVAAQQDRVSEDIWQEVLSTALEDGEVVSISEAAAKIGLDVTKVNRAEQNRIVGSLKALGFARDGKFTSGPHRNSARYVRQG